ncbi:MAG: Flp pilus assembly complex ATPase component TadA [Proteobacteria bacterium]|nr:Flp pilus assembly complex ATPase component TadA [Pseudomonadota bacterium]
MPVQLPQRKPDAPEARRPTPAEAGADFIEFLIAHGVLGAAERARVSALRAARGESDAVILTRLGLVSELAMAEQLAAFHGLPRARPEDYPAQPLLGDALAPGFLMRSRLVPFHDRPDGIAVAMADPTDRAALEAVRLAAGKPVLPWVAVPSELEAALARLYGAGDAPDVALAPAEPAAAMPDDERRLAESASEEPVIRYVNGLLARAAALRASDIHIESVEGRLVQRVRIDGVLRPLDGQPPRLHGSIVSRVKIMAGLNIAERRLPQDGRFRTIVEGREIDVRVSIVPTLHGESAVLRLLDRARAPLVLPELGFSPTLEHGLVRLLDQPNGIILVTGPTGSGKTSTLYAALQRLNTDARKILTAEDPIEYQLAGINQIQVRPAIGLSFATLLRSLLRQDPDVLLVGEIRDLETARIAVQASLTGHLVLSTVHTNDAPSTLTRLIDMGLEPYLLTSVLRGVVGQRLVRTLCQACREPYAPLPELVARLGLAALAPAGVPPLHRAVGCAACGGTGHHGRTVIAELLVPDERLHRAVLSGDDAVALNAAAAAGGMVDMRTDGLRKVLAGVTSLDEVLRVAGAGSGAA